MIDFSFFVCFVYYNEKRLTGGKMIETLSEWQERPQVLAAIRPYYEQRGLVKVLTGMRRVGKSTVLKLIAKELREHGKTDADFFFINCEDCFNRWMCHFFII